MIDNLLQRITAKRMRTAITSRDWVTGKDLYMDLKFISAIATIAISFPITIGYNKLAWRSATYVATYRRNFNKDRTCFYCFRVLTESSIFAQYELLHNNIDRDEICASTENTLEWKYAFPRQRKKKVKLQFALFHKLPADPPTRGSTTTFTTVSQYDCYSMICIIGRFA